MELPVLQSCAENYCEFHDRFDCDCEWKWFNGQLTNHYSTLLACHHTITRREAEQLVAQRIHPQTIAAGWRLARAEARKALEDATQDHSSDPEQFRNDLLQIAQTTLSSKLLTHEKEYFANLAVDAVLRLKGSNNLEHIQVLKKPGGSLRDSYLEDGFLLDKTVGIGQPHRVENAKILIANTSMDTDKIKIYGSRVKVTSLNKVAEIEQAEKVWDCVIVCVFHMT